MTSLWCVLDLAAKEDMDLVQMDVQIAFLHGDLHEEIYMQQLEGFEEKGKNLWCASWKRAFMVLNKHLGTGITSSMPLGFPKGIRGVK